MRKKDKKGIRKLSDKDDFKKIFGVSEEKTGEDFGTLFEAQQSSVNYSEIVSEKSIGSESNDLRRDRNRTVTGRIEDEVDLHRLTANEAKLKVEQFILSSKRDRLKRVRIITGKGHHSQKRGGVLRDEIEKQIIDMKKRGTLRGWHWEKKQKYRSGAIIALI